MASTRGKGRPSRSDRYYALIGLIHSAAISIRSDQDAPRSIIAIGTPRALTAKTTGLKPGYVTNAIAKAIERKLYTRELFKSTMGLPVPRNSTQGRLTPAGIKALGPVTSAWKEAGLGDQWWPTGWPVKEHADPETVIKVLGDEFRRERSLDASTS